MKTKQTIGPLAAGVLLAVQILAAEREGSSYVNIPSERDVGKVYIASLVASNLISVPERIVIYPAIFPRDGEIFVANSFVGLIEGDEVSEFFRILAAPTSIGTADEACPNIILGLRGSGAITNSSFEIQGSILIRAVDDYVRIRLHTRDPLYPKIDFVYEGVGLGGWLTKRSVEAPWEGTSSR